MMFLVYFFGSVIAMYFFCLPICSRAGVCELECEWDTVKKHEGQAVLDTDNSHTFQIHRYMLYRARAIMWKHLTQFYSGD